jgi:diaminohydroxyphosphoribosylaminopyrimidine deaminase/5-amino-6-(5-phosphoribosylamino)uracil reductase
MGQSQWITGEAARLHGHSLRNIYDAILVGIGTVTADNPSLTCRLPGQTGRDPIRIIVDSKLSIGEDTRVLNQSSTAPTIIAVTAQAPADKVKLLSIEEKAIILTVNEGPEVHLPTLLEMLGKRQITSILVEGGSRINSSFLTQKLVDKFYFYLAPKIIGGARAPGSFGGKGVTTLKEAVELTDLSLDKLEPDILVIGYPKKEEG